MSQRKQEHLQEDKIIELIIDDNLDDDAVKQHLKECNSCQQRKLAIETSLARLGEAAFRHVPPLWRPPIVFQEDLAVTPLRHRYGWKAVMTPAMVVIVFVSLWIFIHHTFGPKPFVETDFGQQQEEQLMTEIGQLAENPLPSFYNEIISETDEDLDDAFFDFLISPLDEQTSSLIKRGAPC